MSIARMRGWHERNGLILPPEGESAGWIQFQGRAAWADLTTLVSLQTTTPGLLVESVSAPEPTVTIEGEDGVLVTARGRFNGAIVQRDLGYVFGEGFVSCVSSVVLAPGRFSAFTETVWHLLRSVRLGLGHRRRAFRHAPPAGWRVDAGSSDPVCYRSPEDPFVRLDVWRAAPLSRMAAHDYLSFGDGVEQEHKEGPRPIRAGRLLGTVWETIGRCGKVSILRRVVILEDGRYAYPIRLDCNLATRSSSAREGLDELLHSIVPIPVAVAA